MSSPVAQNVDTGETERCVRREQAREENAKRRAEVMVSGFSSAKLVLVSSVHYHSNRGPAV